MADKFLPIGGADYDQNVARALKVNAHGELATENVLGKAIVFDTRDFVPGESATFTIPGEEIPKGTAYYGVYIARNNNLYNFKLHIDTDKNTRHFSQPAEYLRQTYSFKEGGEAYIVRPLATEGTGSLRINFENGKYPARFSVWIIYFRNAIPCEAGLEDDVPLKLIRTETATVDPGQSKTWGGDLIGRWRKISFSVAVTVSHDYEARLSVARPGGYVLTAQPAIPRAHQGHSFSDFFTLPSNDAAPIIYNHSSVPQEYTIYIYGMN